MCSVVGQCEGQCASSLSGQCAIVAGVHRPLSLILEGVSSILALSHHIFFEILVVLIFNKPLYHVCRGCMTDQGQIQNYFNVQCTILKLIFTEEHLVMSLQVSSKGGEGGGDLDPPSVSSCRWGFNYSGRLDTLGEVHALYTLGQLASAPVQCSSPLITDSQHSQL